MLDALHNLVSFARERGVSQVAIIATDTATIVDLYCETIKDYTAAAGMLLAKGAAWEIETYYAALGDKRWLRGVLSFGGIQFVVLGPQHAVTQEAA